MTDVNTANHGDGPGSALRPSRVANVYAEGMMICLRVIYGVRDATPDHKLAVFRNQAREVAGFVRAGGVDKQDAVDRLADAAKAIGFDPDTAQAALAEAFAPRQETATGKIQSSASKNRLQSSANGAAQPKLDIICAADVKPLPVDWLWPNWLPMGKTIVLAGEGGLGKSTILLAFAAAVTNGVKWPDGALPRINGSVLILASEDDLADTLAPRLIAAGADRSKVFVIRSVLNPDDTRRTFSLQADLARLEAEITQRGDVKLVIIDPVTSYLGKVDSHKNADVRSVLEPLGELAGRLHVAVICNNHFSKAGGSANSKIIGSVAFVNQARAAMIVTPDAEHEGRRLLIPSKTTNGPMQHGLAYRIGGIEIDGHDGERIMTSQILWESEPVKISADDAVAALAEGNEAKTAKSEAIEFLKDALARGPADVLEVETQARAAGLLGDGQRFRQSKVFRAARDALSIQSAHHGFGPSARYVLSLPSAPCAPSTTMCALSQDRAHMGNEGAHGGVGDDAAREALGIRADLEGFGPNGIGDDLSANGGDHVGRGHQCQQCGEYGETLECSVNGETVRLHKDCRRHWMTQQ